MTYEPDPALKILDMAEQAATACAASATVFIAVSKE